MKISTLWFIVGVGFTLLCPASTELYFNVVDGNGIINSIEGLLLLIILISAFFGVIGLWIASQYEDDKKYKEKLVREKQ